MHSARAAAVLVAVNALGFLLTGWVRAHRTGGGFGGPPPEAPGVGAWLGYVAGWTRGDLGTIPGPIPRPVATLVVEALPRSLALLALAMAVAAVVGVAAGLAAVDRRRGRTRPLALLTSLAGFSMPGFYAGILLIEGMLVAARLAGRPGEPWLPASGYGLDAHLVLPVVALALRPAAEIARLVAELVSEELGREYLRMAAAKGLSPRLRLLRHAFPNVAATVAVAIGGSLRYLVSSLIAVELLFGWNGLGMRLAQALAARTDGRPSEALLLHPETVAALLTVFAAFFLVATTLTDLSARSLDPRQRPAPADRAAVTAA